MQAMDAEVQRLVQEHAPHFTVTAEGKVKCELNGHTFPPKAEALTAFINGKKYAKLLKAAELDRGLARYEPFIVRSKNLPGTLFCALTGELMNARLEEVKQHLKGKKFARAKERFERDEQELLEEPDMEGSDMEEDEEGPGVWVPEEILKEYEMGEAEEEGGAEEEEEGEDEEDAAAAGSKKQAKPAKEKSKGRQAAAAAAGGQNGSAAAGKAGGKGKQQKAKAEQAASGGGSGKAKQQKQAAAANGANGSGKAKAPKAKKARTS